MTLDEYLINLEEIKFFRQYFRLRRLLENTVTTRRISKYKKYRKESSRYPLLSSTHTASINTDKEDVKLASVEKKPWQEIPLCTGYIQSCKSGLFCQSKLVSSIRTIFN